MSVKQLSIFLENKGGRLADVTKVLGENSVDISALSIADTTDFGILRMIVSDPVKAESALKDAGYAVSITEVLAIAIDDDPGSLSKVLQSLVAQGIEVEYIYAFIGKNDKRALVVVKVQDMSKAAEVLKEADVCILNDEEVYKL